MYSRRILLIGAMLMALLSSTTIAPTVASAEIAPVQNTWWGLATTGTSRVLNGWNNDPLGWAVEQSGGAMFVGGQFLDITNGQETIRQPYLAAFDAGDGTPLRWFEPDFGGPVLALRSTPDGGLVVGGEMDEFEGQTVGALVKLDPLTGEAWPGWQTRVFGGTSVVRDIRVESDGWMYVVGDFSMANDGTGLRAVGSAIRMNPTTGAIDWSWLPQVAGGSVWGVSASQTSSEVYLAGWFTSINGNSSARGFGSVDDNGNFLNGRGTVPYNTCVGCSGYYRMYDVLATEYGDVWVVGEQHSVFVLDESTLEMKLHHYTGCNRRFQANCTRAGGEFQEIERVGDRIYATCHCWGWHQTDTQTIYHSSRPSGTPTGSVSSIVAYDPQTGQRIQSVNPYMSGKAGGFAITEATDGCLWIAGGFTQVGPIGNQRRARDLVRLCDEAGPGPDPLPNPVDPNAPADVAAPASCSASADDLDAVISWEASADATNYRVFRTVDGGNSYWRGVSTTTTFNDTLRLGKSHEYSVSAKGETGVWSENTPCDPAVVGGGGGADPVIAPASCDATSVGADATISWEASENATDYRVYRSVDGGNTYWRGVTATTTFEDTLRTSGSHQYSVQARGADGIWTSSTPCAPALEIGEVAGPVVRPASCDATPAGTDVTISWEASANAIEYRVYRSVDDATTYWRGKVSVNSFSDTLRSSGSHQYSVQARGADGIWTSSTYCAPAVEV